MTVLPSPIPHPLDFSPWELPGWIYEALDWVVGVEWPDGNERAVWDLADQWYGVAAALAGPQSDAVTAATEVRNGYGGVGAVATAFDQAWRRVAEGDDAPLPVLLAISTDLGRLVEECGCDIEGAKLEVWIELGILVVELLGLAVATVLTAGAASPAAAAVIAATRAIVQQIFKRLMAQLARKALRQGLKEAGERAAKEVTKGGMRGLARRAAVGGLYEAGEEAGVSLATQAYQNSTGRRDGLDLAELGTSAVGGLAGGAVAPLAGLGRHANGRAARVGEHVGREMTGEVLAEQAASLATGQGPTSLEDAARAAASGVRGSATTQADAALQARLDGRMSALAGLPTTPADLRVAPPPDLSALGGGAVAAGPAALDGGTRATGLDGAPAPRPPEAPQVAEAGRVTVQAGSAGTPPSVAVDPVGAGVRGETAVRPDATAAVSHLAGTPVPSEPHTTVPAPVDAPSIAAPHGLAGDSTVTSPYHLPDSPTLTSAAAVAPTPTVPVSSPAPPPVDGLSSAAGPSVTTGGPPTSGSTPYPVAATAGPTTSPATAGPAVTAVPSPAAPTTSVTTPTDSVGTTPPRHPTEAVPQRSGPTAPVPPPADGGSGSGGVGVTPASARGGSEALRPRTPEWYAAQWAADRDAFERRRYRGYFESQRERHEEKRRFREVTRLRALADEHYRRAHEFAAQALRLRRAGLIRASHAWQEAADEATQQYGEHYDEAEAVLSGAVTPVVVEVGKEDFRSINDDVGDLTLGAVDTGNRSALTGDDDPPPIDHTRRYGVRGGLRPPLALHQTDVERQMPRHLDGTVVRTADPRRGGWFRLMNDGGPQADPTRGINCLDCTLSLFDTWVHGRPRVAAPRTFDAYENGNVTRPLDGEADGPGRIEDVTGGRFQRLCAPGDGTSPVHPKHALDAGYRNLHDQLIIGGHGSFAFVINQWEGGGSHIWVALNQNGTVLYLDPQSGEISDRPLGAHRGHPHSRNAIDADVLILGPDARPMPLAGLRRGLFSQRPDLPAYPPAREHQGYGEPYLNRMHLLAGPGSAEPTGDTSGGMLSGRLPGISAAELAYLVDLREQAARVADEVENALSQVGDRVTRALDLEEPVRLRDQRHRLKSLDSLVRKYHDEGQLSGLTVEEFGAEVNDVLRFSFAMPRGDRYRDSVVEVLSSLESAGFHVPDHHCKNFWRVGNRFYGFNCTVQSSDGLFFELQLHSDMSREAWLETHEAYETLRSLDEPSDRRVDAFLQMLAVNRRLRLPDEVPEGLKERFPAKDASFAKWIAGNGSVWREYRDWLESRGSSFQDVIERHGLGAEDFPITPDVLSRLEKRDAGLLPGLPE